MTECPKCASTDVRSSRCKFPWEAWRKHVLKASPYRCGRCNWRGWGPDAPDAPRVQPSCPATSQPVIDEMAFAAAPPRWDELDFHVLNIPRGPLHGHNESF